MASTPSTTAPSFQMPVDRQAQSLQVLSPVYATSVNGSVTNSSARVTLPTDSDIVFISNTQDAWIKFGNSAVSIASGGESGSFLLLAGERVFQKPQGVTHLAFLRVSVDGVINVTNLN